MGEEMKMAPTAKHIRAIRNSLQQTFGARIRHAPNEWAGLDFETDTDRTVRVMPGDAGVGLEVYAFDEHGACQTQATFSTAGPAATAYIVELIRAALEAPVEPPQIVHVV